MNDDQMDELLRQGARDYNEPGAVPRDEMWAAIASARRNRAQTATVPRRSRRPIWVWPGVGIAAAGLVAIGIAIGRDSGFGTRDSVNQPGHGIRDSVRSIVAAKPVGTSNAAARPDSIVEQLHQETRKTDAEVRRLAEAGTAHRGSSESRVPNPESRQSSPESRAPAVESRVPTSESRDSRTSSLAYRLVVLRHLAGSEALITSFRTSAKRGEMDSQIAQWSRELLSTTRLLEASPAVDDPVMKRLLEDLDLIIAQIAVYSARGTNNPEELDLIEQSINQRGVIPKLRSTMPAPTNSAHM
jgi:hypothetical protein